MGNNRNEIQSDNTRVVQKPIVLPIKHRLKPNEVFLTDRNTGEKVLVKIPNATIGPDRRNDYQRQQGQNKAQQLYKQREEEREQKERMEALQGFFTFILPSTYIGPVFNSNGKPYLDNVLSGEGSGSTDVNLAIDLLTPFGPKGINKGIKTFPKLLRRRLTVFQSPKNLEIQNNLTSHLQGEEAVKMFKQYGGVEIPEGSINGQQLRMYVPEARERYGLVGNTNITDEEIAKALYKHSQELGEGSAAKNIQGEPQLLFRGDTKRYTELKPRITPEELAKGGGTMDNSLGTLFLGELPSQRGGLERYIATVRDFRGVKRLVGSGTGSRAKLPNGDIVKEYVNDEIAVIPEGSYQLFSQPIRQDNISVYKLPASLTETGVNDINAFVVRTPNMRDATREISVLNDDFLVLNGPKVDYYGPVRRQVLDKDGFPLLVDEKGTVVGNGLAGSSERNAMVEHYQQVLNKAQAEQQGLLKSNKNSYLRDEHSGYDYFALPNFNIRGAKHLLPYDLRIPRNWNDPNIYKSIIPIGVTTYGIDTQHNKYGGKLIPHKNNGK